MMKKLNNHDGIPLQLEKPATNDSKADSKKGFKERKQE